MEGLACANATDCLRGAFFIFAGFFIFVGSGETPSAWSSGVPTGVAAGDGFICSDSGSTGRLSATTVLMHASIYPGAA